MSPMPAHRLIDDLSAADECLTRDDVARAQAFALIAIAHALNSIADDIARMGLSR